MVAKVQLYSYIHKRKGHKVLKKRRKGSRQPKKKEEIPLSLNSVCPACISSVLLSSLTFCYLWGLQGFGAIRFAFGVQQFKEMSHRGTERMEEYQSMHWQAHGGTVCAWSDGACLPILLAIYMRSIHTKRVIRNLYATPPSLFVPPVPP